MKIYNITRAKLPLPLTLFLLLIVPNMLLAQSASEYKDISYASVDDMDLVLDIYVPSNVDAPPLVIYVHGGAWRFGTKEDGVPMEFVEAGFAVASLDFRQSSEDIDFPAMVHDIKAGVRFLRASAGDYGYDASKVAITGASSGAHLAQMVGVSNGHSELEGNLGNHTSVSSDIQAIVSYFGASDLTTILSQSTPFGLNVRTPALELLLGALPEDDMGQAELASPVYHVDASDPPLLLLHGDRDPQMPINQTLQMFGAYKAASLDVYFDPVHGAVHGGPGFFDPEHLQRAIEFLNRTIR
jgi:acetyl esterase/lipase